MMKRRYLPAALLALGLALLAGFSAGAAPLGADETLKLPSGRSAKILSESKVEYSKGVMALMVRYQTTLSIDEGKAVSQEVDEVWKLKQKDVERAGYTDAIISCNETPRGIIITSSRVATFIYEKGPDSKWTRLNRADMVATQ